VANNIILIGFMAVGKGRTARELARQTGKFAVDTDDLIESLAKQKIRKIFKDHGEDHFRGLEAVTAKWLENNVSNTIISTGGGFYKAGNLKRIGTVIHLHASLEAIISVIKQHPKSAKKIRKRPLLQDFSKARSLYEERLPLYRKAAHHEIHIEDMTTAEVAEIIVKLLGSGPGAPHD
jgi:shikimate kinase